MVDVDSKSLVSVGGGGRRRIYVLILDTNMNKDINMTVELD